MKKLVLALCGLLFATSIMAHGTMDATTPPDGAILQAAPPFIGFEFEEPVKLTRVQIARVEEIENGDVSNGEEDEGEEREINIDDLEVQNIAETLSEVGGDPADLQLEEQQSFQTSFVFAIDELPAGSYELTLRGLGQDGHPMTQTSTFQIK